jgi:hypothetical protein
MTKQKIQMRSAALKAKWTQINEKSAKIFQEEIEWEVLKIFQEEIDWEVLTTLLVEHGWTKVEISQDGMYMVKKWVGENIQGKYKVRGTTWLFESEKDATMFILRWS